MNKEKEIKRWMNNPNHTIKRGKELYSKYGNNQRIIRKVENVNGRKRKLDILENELKIIAGLPILPKKPRRKAKKEANKPKVKPEAKPTHIPPDAPEDLKKVYEEKKNKYIQVRNLHSKMAHHPEKEERRKLAEQILKLWDEINTCWKKIDYFNQNNKLPDPEILEIKNKIKTDTSDPAALERRKRTLATYISKAKKDPERNAENLIDWQTEKEAITEILENN